MNSYLILGSSQELIRKNDSQYYGPIGLSARCKRRYMKSSRRDKIEYNFSIYNVGSA
jgi:hypothetical protein